MSKQARIEEQLRWRRCAGYVRGIPRLSRLVPDAWVARRATPFSLFRPEATASYWLRAGLPLVARVNAPVGQEGSPEQVRAIL